MHVLCIDSIEKETYGGMEEWIRLVALGLCERGHRVSVAGRPHSEFLRRIGDDNDIEKLPVEFGGDFNPAAIGRLSSYIHQYDVDIVTVNFNKDLRLGGLAAKLQGGVRVVWSVGLNITSEGMAHRILTPRLVDSVIVPSEALKNQICSRGYIAREIVEVIPIGIADRNPPNREAARKRLLDEYDFDDDALVAVTSGRFVEQKGHAHLVGAVAGLQQEFPHLRLLWLGDGPLRDRLKAQVAEANLDDRVVFCGMLDDTAPILDGCDLMVHPSVEEPFGIVLTEGMRAGLPIVASRVGGIPEVVAEDETALLVEAADVDRLASAIKRMLDDAELRQRFGQSGRVRFEERFKLESMIDRVEHHLSRVVAEGRPYGSPETP